MAKPNYQYEKRQRELAKKKKKEEKAEGRKREADAPEGSSEGVSDEAPAASPDAAEPSQPQP